MKTEQAFGFNESAHIRAGAAGRRTAGLETEVGRERQEAKSEAAVAKALEAALEVFSSQGFRGSTMRQLADAAGLSVGNLYHHFGSKEAIFERLLEQYWDRLLDPELPLNRVFARGRFPEDLEDLAAATEQVVEANIRYILLIYIDVIEFQGQHIHDFYQDMAHRFSDVYAESLEQRKQRGELGDVDPMAAVMVESRWFFYYFTVEKCFGVPMHLGISPQQAVDEFIRLFRYGLLPRSDRSHPTPAADPEPGQANAP